jgi:hypothetical protein
MCSVSFVSLDHLVFQVMACSQAASAYDSVRCNYAVQLFQYTTFPYQKTSTEIALPVNNGFFFSYLRVAKLLKHPAAIVGEQIFPILDRFRSSKAHFTLKTTSQEYCMFPCS